MTSPDLTAWATTRPDRCPTCGFHLARQACTCASSEWGRFVTALHAAAGTDGLIHQRDMRPLIRGRVEPKHIGTFYRRAKAEGLIADTGEREPSSDVIGRNADKLDRIYALRASP